MTDPQRIARCVARLAASWPRVQLGEAHVDALVSGLLDLPAVEVEQAVEFARRTMQFPPSLAELRTVVAHRRFGFPDSGAALEQAIAAARAEPSWTSCAAACDEGFVDREVGKLCLACGGEGRVRKHGPALPEPTRRAVAALGGLRAFAESERPGVTRHEFVRLYDEFRAEAERAVVAGAALPPSNMELTA